MYCTSGAWGGKMRYYLKRTFLVGTAVLYANASAYADQASDTAGSQAIVVVAQRRAEDPQRVPISLGVMSGKSLADSGILRADDLQLRDPTLTILGNNSPQGQLNLIRGVGTFSYSDAVEPSVGTAIDSVVLGRQGMGLTDLYDIDHIEVLRGPQGTLFGKNANAGLINIITNAPSFHTGGEARVSYGNYNEVSASGALTGAIVPDTVAARVAVLYHRRDGFIDQPVLNTKIGGIDRLGVRGKLLFEPVGGNVSALLTLDYYRTHDHCCHPTVRSYGSAVQAYLIAPVIGAPGPGNLVSASETPIYNRSRSLAATLEMKGDLGSGLTLTSVTGYRDWTNRNSTENDGTPLPILNAPGDYARTHDRQFTQELRLASSARDRLFYTLGLYYFQLKAASSHLDSGSLGVDLPAGFLFSSFIAATSKSTNYAAFGDVSFHATPRLLLTAGARLLRDTVAARYDRTSDFPLPGTTLGDTSSAAATRGDTNYTARGVAQYQWTPDVMSYASIARGYKGFGADIYSPPPAQAGVSYASTFALPENSLAYEIGLKSNLLDHRVTIDIAGFWSDFNNLQLSLFNPQVAQYVLLNARKFRTRGVELAIAAHPAKALALTASGAYTDTALVSFPGVPCVPGPSPVACIDGTRNFTGGRSPLSPDFAFVLSAEYTHELRPGMGIDGRLDYSWKSSILFSTDQDPNKVQGPVGILNARVGLAFGAGQQTQLSGYVRNLTNKRWTNLLFDSAVWGGYSQYPEIGRTYGVEIASRF